MSFRLLTILYWMSGLSALLLFTLMAASQAGGKSSPQKPAGVATRPQSKNLAVSLPKMSVQTDLDDTTDRESRIECANHLQQMGVEVDWRKHDLLYLADLESRVESARRLQKMGVAVDWRKYDSATLSDMVTRVETAQELKHLGVNVDWRKYDLLTLLDMQTLAETVQRLQQRGITLNWRYNGNVIAINSGHTPGSEARR